MFNLVVFVREGIEKVYLELVLSIVGVVVDTGGCTDDEVSMAGMDNNDEAVWVLMLVVLTREDIEEVYLELVFSILGIVEDTVG